MTAASRRQTPARRRDAQHVQLAAREPVGGDPLGEQGQEVVARQTTTALPPRYVPRLVTIAGGAHGPHQRLAQERDAVRLRPASARARGWPSRLSTRSSCGLHSAAAKLGLAQHREPLGRLRPAQQPAVSPISVARNASSTARASGRRAATREAAMHDRRCRPRPATSAQTSRERMARSQHLPRCCPVTVTKPKLRIEAPLACASRSMTTTRLARAAPPPAHARARRCPRRRRRDRNRPMRSQSPLPPGLRQRSRKPAP